MKATANEVNAGQTVHPRAAKSNDTNAVTAPKPTLLNANPVPGSSTAANTLLSGGGLWSVGTTRGSGAASSSVTSGTTVVATAIAAKP